MYRNGRYKSASEAFIHLPQLKTQYSQYKAPIVGNQRVESKPVIHHKPQKPLEIKWETKRYVNTADPNVWGPPFWFSYHNGAAHYPVKASKYHKERMKGVILGIPVLMPCVGCKPHAIAYIESRMSEMDHIVSGREPLSRFFVDFHNKVNERYRKRIVSYEEAKKMYNNGINISKMVYK